MKKSINSNWEFFTEKEWIAHLYDHSVNGTKVNIPHTWNNIDAVDEESGYFRGIGYYKKEIFIPLNYKDKDLSLLFEGVNQVATVFINDVEVGIHKGGYTRFIFDVHQYLKFGEQNKMIIKVDNSYDENIAPLSADFTFFGGIYRDVFLEVKNKIHWKKDEYAGATVHINTPNVTKDKASVRFRGHINNTLTTNQTVTLKCKLIAPNQSVVYQSAKKQKLVKSADKEIDETFEINNPLLWNTETPNLYQLHLSIIDEKSGKELDSFISSVGFRWYSFDVKNGFVLNGEPLKLIGTNRHQCFEGLGNALPDELHVRDIKLLKEMGGNFLRVSHYPQDPVVMEMCDKLGILTSVEIPLVNAITETEEFTNNSVHMVKEMIHQNRNHPSVIMWAYMNEILLRPPFKKDKERHKKYLVKVKELTQLLENTVKELDEERYTMNAHHGSGAYHEAEICAIPDIMGWNLYSGWYGGKFSGFEKFLDKYQALYPDKVMMVTEYGADVHADLHSFNPIRFDYTVEYGNLYHEHYLPAILERNFIAGAAIWNINDFHSELRGYATPHINSKGITTTDRTPKDTYYLYQANFLKEPFLKIGDRTWTLRSGQESNGICKQPVVVYSNQEKVTLSVNGKELGEQKVTLGKATFNVPFQDGNNQIVAKSGELLIDMLDIEFRMIPESFTSSDVPLYEINVDLGSTRYYHDKTLNQIWIPEKEYTSGSWGYIGGEAFKVKTKYGSMPASDLEIYGTKNDPIYQTNRMDLEAFKFDVKDGFYTVELHFAELLAKSDKEALAYNLGNDKVEENINERVFSILINDELVEEELNLAKEFGGARAVIKKFQVKAVDGQGIIINCKSIKDKSLISAIRLYKNY
ncbi:DUF4982 domain-containing protein [Flammeovirga yaeyamensis]|uniref:DUF4982 domain-containing protein n=1 Tax=Flammeovirga yaeyamensis TaxID=367791 RepID=A0AAX1N2I7_9BACT|nr:glycoside hydrolase family 2 TIM barrel-domain containing protein [Flammeovirga yaeyamensis]MBB3700759.1 beta-galactosidase [Flammeovirga yaeyamensis]QWG01754.1 DUF4982 domain-containing protein [Flammeovirga yaeyamensis]